MIVYLSTKAGFREDVLSNRIEERVLDSLKSSLQYGVGRSELMSWKNSLPYMDRVLSDAAIPDNVGVAIEYSIPNTSKRVDFIVTGSDYSGVRTSVIVELKQWEKADKTPIDGVVSTYVGGRTREVSHPSYQAWSYAMLMEDYNETVRTEPILLKPCAYLHNCDSTTSINTETYESYVNRAPVFFKDDARKLQEFIKGHLKYGDNGDAIYLIQDGKVIPSKSLADHLQSLLVGNQEFYMIDDQKVVYETALHLASISGPENKHVLIVNGGPGTGKSVVAINLLVEMTKKEMLVQYVTKNAAPRAVYESKLAGTFKKSRISSLFVGSGTFTETPSDFYQALIVDEAHRLNEKSGMMQNLGENQVKEIINASALAVFFLDEDQRIHWKDIGSREEVMHWAEAIGAKITELSLESQFRCNGADGYLSWLDNALCIKDTANKTMEGINYEFKVCESASELRDVIYEKNRINNKARMVAGYCWDWESKKSPSKDDIVFPEQGFSAKWNLAVDGSLWIVKPESVSEVGCIHTCQGLELDYVGVIIGDDFFARNGEVGTSPLARSKNDASMKGFKKAEKQDSVAARNKADGIIKNTYRTLMTRGMKGCYIYCVDKQTNEYFKSISTGAPVIEQPEIEKVVPYEFVKPEEVQPFVNAIPLFEIEAAAGSFSHDQSDEEYQWVTLPEHFAIREGYFVAKVVGESMNQKIPNGSYCLFKANPGGSRNNDIVLCCHRSIRDAAYAGTYTVKQYFSEKNAVDDNWRHSRITLKPMSNQKGYEDIVIEDNDVGDFQIVGVFVAVI
jgi:DUF2075 family protein